MGSPQGEAQLGGLPLFNQIKYYLLLIPLINIKLTLVALKHLPEHPKTLSDQHGTFPVLSPLYYSDSGDSKTYL